jgi:hypothetical protein
MQSIQNEKLNKLKIVKSQIDELDDDLSTIS